MDQADQRVGIGGFQFGQGAVLEYLRRKLVQLRQGHQHVHVGRIAGALLGLFLDRQFELFEQDEAELLA
jgi:hypothetical protein